MGACENFLPGEEIHGTFRRGKHGVAGLQNETGSIRVLKAAPADSKWLRGYQGRGLGGRKEGLTTQDTGTESMVARFSMWCKYRSLVAHEIASRTVCSKG